VAAGAQVRTQATVQRIMVHDDRAAGVVLTCGEEIRAASVISSADPKTTFLELLGSEYLDAGFVRRVAQLRSRGLTAKLHLALERLPDFPGLGEPALRGRLLVAPSSDYIERAYNHAKYDEFSAAPMLEVTIPTLADPGLAPAGQHVMSVIVQYAPYALKDGWAEQRLRFTDLVIDTLGAYAPQLRGCIRASELLNPQDIEREFRITGGHWHHAELALDQFFMVRPQRGTAGHARGGLENAHRERTALPPAAAEDAVPRTRPRREPARQLRSLERLHHRRRLHQRGAGVFRDPQRELPLRPDADGQVPHRRSRRPALPQPADDARHP
jgi:phytoene dehydrogenase-like protein